MRIQPSAYIDKMAGKQKNAIVFCVAKGSSGGNIQYARDYVVPFNPDTPDQQAVRDGFQKASAFFYDATDKTIGATSFTRAQFLLDIDAIASVLRYRGVPTTGASANRQIWIMAAIAFGKSIADYTEFDVLPQDIVLEADLINLLDTIQDALNFVKSRQQATRIGYIS